MRDLSKVQIHLNDAKNHSKSLLGMANYLNVRNIKLPEVVVGLPPQLRNF